MPIQNRRDHNPFGSTIRWYDGHNFLLRWQNLSMQSEAAKKHKTEVLADGEGGQGKETKLILETLLANLR